MSAAVRTEAAGMAKSLGWTRNGRKGRFRYYDGAGREIEDPPRLERIEKLVIPPAWRDVWIAPTARAKLQATGYDNAGRKQYLYHPDYRAAQEAAKYEKLIRFGEKLPDLRRVMSEHMDRDVVDRERVSAVALRLINLGWFRVGNERYARESKTYGITTLTRRHVEVRGKRITLRFRAKHGAQVRSTFVDEELADALRELLALRGGSRVFRYRWEDKVWNLTSKRLNDYVKIYLGDEFTAKDFRTWGGTLLAAIALAERVAREGYPETATAQKRSVTAVMRRVAEQLGNTPAVTRASYVSPAVVEQYLDGRTIEDFRPRHLRVVGARDISLDPEEQALLSLLRSWKIRRARAAA
jgi:DNA topoisomerase IB